MSLLRSYVLVWTYITNANAFDYKDIASLKLIKGKRFIIYVEMGNVNNTNFVLDIIKG